jgi:hypothetical protein
VNVTINWPKIAERTAKKVDARAMAVGHVPASGTQLALRCSGIAVSGRSAMMNGLPATKYPFPEYEIETGEVAIVKLPEPSPEYVN